MVRSDNFYATLWSLVGNENNLIATPFHSVP